MPLFRKKPVVIEAFVWDGRVDSLTDAGAPWVCRDGMIFLGTLEGPIRPSVGDYIIKGVAGEFYPCKPDIFAKTYEAVE